jgi:hypothetical protein
MFVFTGFSGRRGDSVSDDPVWQLWRRIERLKIQCVRLYDEQQVIHMLLRIYELDVLDIGCV